MFKPPRIALFVALIMVAAGCGAPTGESGDSGSGGGKTVTIGLLAPITGVAAADGKLMQEGAQQAVDELNAAGGVAGHTFKLKVADVKGQESDAVSAAVAQLTSDPSVGVVITGYASTTNFEIDLLADAEMPYLLASNSEQTRDIVAKNPAKYPGVWSITPSYDAYGTDLPARVAAWDKEGKVPQRNHKAYIVSSDNPYSNSIADGLTKNFRAQGWTVDGPEKVPFGEVNDWTAQLTKIRRANPEVIVNTDYLTANSVKFLAQFRENPTKSLVFLQYAPSTPEFLKLAGGKADGVFYNLLGAGIDSPKVPKGAAAVAAFKKKFGQDPGTYGISVHELVTLYAEALKKVGDPAKKAQVGAAIGKLDINTALGRIVFDPATHLAKQGNDYVPLQFFQIQNGGRVLLGPPQYATGSLVMPSWVK
jgi:branched-chain amino acid transport system substrate-binding protein